MSDRTNWSNDDLDDEEFPEEDSVDDDDGVETIACPNCRAQVYEDAEQCPECGEYLIADTNPLSGRAWWFIALGIVGTVALIGALVFGF